MKKLLLSLGVVLVGSTAMSQVIFSVEEPASITGFYDFTSNGDGSNWGLANLTGVLVEDTVMIANDGTTGTNADGKPFSGEACNGAGMNDLTGKVALIYRGTCGFGVKAQNAQNAGAVAVIIVNRNEEMVNMDGGTEGATVTIPVIFVANSTGTAIVNQINGGSDVVVLIGDKTGHYGDDLSIFDNKVIRANFGSKPLALAQSASEFSFTPGSWVYNNGQNDQSTVTVNVMIDRDGSNVYDQTSAAVAIVSGDSAYFTTPAYSAASYQAGKYKVTYTVSLGSTSDEFGGDNTSVNYFSLDNELWSLARLDTTGGAMVAKDGFYRPATLPTSTFESCMAFKDANASRVAMDGLYFGGMTVGTADTATVNLDGFEVTWSLYTWNDADKTVTNGTITNISEVASGSYVYPDPADAMFEETVFMPMTSGNGTYRFVDNQQYLVCINNYSPKVYMAFSTMDYYDLLIENDDLIRFPLRSDLGTFTNGGFGIAPSVALRTGTDLSVEETIVEASAYPNPTKDVINVKVNANGDATLKVTDLAGRQVSVENIKIENGSFSTNVGNMTTGTYVFTIDYANGTSSRFNVVVTK